MYSSKFDRKVKIEFEVDLLGELWRGRYLSNIRGTFTEVRIILQSLGKFGPQAELYSQ